MSHALIFDSGIGGLSVASHISSLLPKLSLTYAADDAYRPYGNKTEAQLNARLPHLLAALENMCAPDVIVIACNTASTTALPGIRAACRAPIVGVVPAIKPAAQLTRSGAIAVLGTPGTVRRDYVDDLISDFASGCDVTLTGSTALVEMAEQKLAGRAVDIDALRAQIAPIFAGARCADIDVIVLACTHFPLLAQELALAAPHPVKWIDSGAAIARRVRSLLEQNSAQARGNTDTLRAVNTALLVGPDPDQARRKAFAEFGFNRVVGLMP